MYFNKAKRYAGLIMKQYLVGTKAERGLILGVTRFHALCSKIPKAIKRFYWTRIFQLVCLNILIKEFLEEMNEDEEETKKKGKKKSKVVKKKEKDKKKNDMRSLFYKALQANR